MRPLAHTFLPLLFLTTTAQAQVLITEVQPNPSGSGTDNGEWIELHNTGSSSVAIGNWSLTDYVGGSLADNINSTAWAFPATAVMAAGEVIIVAKTASGFQNVLGLKPTYELGLGSNNSTSTPDLMAVGGNSVIALANAGSGDAVVLKDEAGMIVDAIEWGTLDRTVMGTPASRPGDGESLVRVATSGSSHVDFVVTGGITPFVGFGSNLPPNILDVRQRPRHPIFGGDFTVSATVTDADGIAEASVFLTTATSSHGPAIMPYQEVTMTASVASRYVFSAPVENLTAGLGFNEPASFHARFIRYYLAAEDTIATRVTFPAEATELASNERFRVRNVLPIAPSNVEQVRQQDQSGTLIWRGLSVRVKGRTTSHGKVFRGDRTNFTVDDGVSGIAVYSTRESVRDVPAGVEVVVTGVMTQYYGLSQIVEPLQIEIVDPTVVAAEAFNVISISELIGFAETLESRVVTLKNLEFVQSTQIWSADGPGGGGNFLVTDGSGEITIRIWEGTNLVGANVPVGPFNITAILSQRAMGGRNGVVGGYQLWPRSSDDIFQGAVSPPDAGLMPMPDAGQPHSSNDGGGGTNSGAPDSGTSEIIKLDGNKPPVADSSCSCYAGGPIDDQQILWPLLLLLAWRFAARRRRA